MNRDRTKPKPEPVESAARLARLAGEAQAAQRWHEAAAYWYAAADYALTESERQAYIKAYVRADFAGRESAA